MIKSQKSKVPPSLTCASPKASARRELRRASKSQNRGFTLIETLAAIGIFTLAFGATTAFILVIYRTQGYAFQQSTAINEARKGVETMVKEIREAKTGDNGSYLIEKADDNEFIFYSDIDKDGEIERVRYFLGGSSSATSTKECVSYSDGGTCSVNFSNFFSGSLETAKITISVEGDFGAGNEYADIFTDGGSSGQSCQNNCDDCAGLWQGQLTFDVKNQALDNNLTLLADASSRVDSICDWIEPNHSMKAKFDLAWTETFSSGQTDFKKGVINPSGFPASYLPENEKTSVLSQYVRNGPAIFRYFDKNGNEVQSLPARPEETTLMRVNLIINVDPNRPPNNFTLESDVQLRNLKTNL